MKNKSLIIGIFFSALTFSLSAFLHNPTKQKFAAEQKRLAEELRRVSDLAADEALFNEKGLDVRHSHLRECCIEGDGNKTIVTIKLDNHSIQETILGSHTFYSKNAKHVPPHSLQKLAFFYCDLIKKRQEQLEYKQTFSCSTTCIIINVAMFLGLVLKNTCEIYSRLNKA